MARRKKRRKHRKASKKARKFVSMDIRRLRHKGYSPKKSVAIAFSQARKKGFKV